ncbi:uncharacterized protein LOC122016834 [Zingiber officinale]|uniref:Uncharacterized protein n=1 Tax=Zingiber officinale TaxID=94328 RepID=A0A8J5F9Q8_ZINOF|nr:uncharacterized protein LOC122016834 [Zingiber officinale]KAG6482443.1 hypothetical protein ZIOFF_059074 [Zingiber officinale]
MGNGLLSTLRWWPSGLRLSAAWSAVSLFLSANLSDAVVSLSGLRWPSDLRLSGLWSAISGAGDSGFRWRAVTAEAIDEVAWAAVTVLESVALISMLCCFFLFCGCSL